MNSETLRTLQEQTKTSDDPMLAYYRWTRFGDEKALQRVLQAESQGEIRNPEVLGALGGHYLRVDPGKAKSLYLLAMKLANKDSFNSDWLLGLAEVYQAQPEQYYLLSKTTVMLTKQGLNQQRLNATINNPQRIAQLDDAAEALAIAISKGRYAESEWPAKLASGQPVPAP